MTKKQLTKRIAHYTAAYEEKKITAHEYNAFIEALAKIAAQEVGA